MKKNEDQDNNYINDFVIDAKDFGVVWYQNNRLFWNCLGGEATVCFLHIWSGAYCFTWGLLREEQR